MDIKELRERPINELNDDEFVKAYGRLVHYTVWLHFRSSLTTIYKNTGLDREDLVQLGNIGLTKARGRFDESKGLKFSTYCMPLIWGEIQRALRESYKVRLGRGIVDVRHKIISMKLLEESPETIAEILDLSLEAVKEALHFVPGCASLNKPLEGTDVELGDTILNTCDEGYDAVGDNDILKGFIETLDERDKRIWYLHSQKDYKQAQIAAELGMTQPRVSRGLLRIFKKAEKFGKQNGLHRGS